MSSLTPIEGPFSRSVFVVEADRQPILAIAAKKHSEAEAFFADERVQAKLKSLNSSGKPVYDDYSILRIRLAHAGERVRYYDARNAAADRGRMTSMSGWIIAIFLGVFQVARWLFWS
jgi:hypothetical protein